MHSATSPFSPLAAKVGQKAMGCYAPSFHPHVPREKKKEKRAVVFLPRSTLEWWKACADVAVVGLGVARCLPIHNFTHVYDYLFSVNSSFVTR